ncbi:MAG: RidA family protein [Chloroflexi bacterium]|jgi:enamine deaminase RidA (YjgF/YER057c/UK114 family)|nr:RidA family protein [Chloroflexota bacterium]
MPKEHLNPPQLFPSLQYGFSQGVTASGGKTVYLSGQVAWDQNQQLVGPGDLHAQARQALRNVSIALQAAGGDLADVVSMRIYIVQEKMGESRAITKALQEFFPGGTPPATTWIGVPSLANRDFLVEIEAIAVIE